MTDLPETVTIPTDEYLDLVESDLLLNQLLSAGVDNWTGYDHIDRAAIKTCLANVRKALEVSA